MRNFDSAAHQEHSDSDGSRRDNSARDNMSPSFYGSQDSAHRTNSLLRIYDRPACEEEEQEFI